MGLGVEPLSLNESSDSESLKLLTSSTPQISPMHGIGNALRRRRRYVTLHELLGKARMPPAHVVSRQSIREF